jgi:RNA polymerase sigma factor (sigma-70 family)
MTHARSLNALLDQTSWIHALARRLVADPSLAADLAQETCVEALERRPGEERPLRGWLATVMRRNLAHLYRGDASRSARERVAARAEREASTLEVLERAETHRNVVLAVLALQEPYRSTLLMRFFEQLSYLEIARRTGVTRASVNSRITRGLELLRQRLEHTYGGDRRALLLVLTPLAKLPTGLAVPFLGVNAMNLTIGLAAATLLATTVSVGFSSGTRGTPEPSSTPGLAQPGASELELRAPLLVASEAPRAAVPQREEQRQKTREAEQESWRTELFDTLALPASVESLAVSTGSGDVEVRASASGRLEIQANVRAQMSKVDRAELTQVFQDHVEILEEEGVLKIEDKHRNSRGWSVSFVVHVPGRMPLSANSGSGDVTIRSAQGKVRANTGSGDVRVELAAERVQSLSANTGSGDIVVQVASVEGKLSANTGSGDVTLLVSDPSSPGETGLNTGSGNVHLIVPANVVGTFELKTSSGGIEVPRALGLEVQKEHGSHRAQGTVGSGAGRYKASSGSGELRVELGNALPVAR